MSPDAEQVNAKLAELLKAVLVPGFHGSVTVSFTVQDGTIQEIETSVKKKHRLTK